MGYKRFIQEGGYIITVTGRNLDKLDFSNLENPIPRNNRQRLFFKNLRTKKEMKSNIVPSPPLPPLSYSLKFAKPKDNKRSSSGTIQHRNVPRFTCRFVIESTPKNGQKRMFHIEDKYISFHDVIFSDTTDLRNGRLNVEDAMQQGASFIYNMLYPLCFRK